MSDSTILYIVSTIFVAGTVYGAIRFQISSLHTDLKDIKKIVELKREKLEGLLTMTIENRTKIVDLEKRMDQIDRREK